MNGDDVVNANDLRPDPTRGREVLDGIDRYRAKIEGRSNVVPFRLATAPVAPIRFEADVVAALAATPCALCGNPLGGTSRAKETKEGLMHRKCERRWFKMSISEREARRVLKASGVRP
jgi:hypothetical protein